MTTNNYNIKNISKESNIQMYEITFNNNQKFIFYFNNNSFTKELAIEVFFNNNTNRAIKDNTIFMILTEITSYEALKTGIIILLSILNKYQLINPTFKFMIMNNEQRQAVEVLGKELNLTGTIENITSNSLGNENTSRDETNSKENKIDKEIKSKKKENTIISKLAIIIFILSAFLLLASIILLFIF